MSATRIDMPAWESFDLLGQSSVGRLCVIDQGYPLAFPLNYRLLQSPTRLVFRTNPTSILSQYRGPASVEIDHIDLPRESAWSIIVRGTLRSHVVNEELAETTPLVGQGRFAWVVLDVATISGRRFTAKVHDDEFTVEWQPVEGPSDHVEQDRRP